jgi:translation initiation factor 6 (eIF-6)
MKYIIDRFEGDLAVCEAEDGKMVEIEKSKLPENAEVGDVIILENGHFLVNKEETDKRRKEIEDLMNELFED